MVGPCAGWVFWFVSTFEGLRTLSSSRARGRPWNFLGLNVHLKGFIKVKYSSLQDLWTWKYERYLWNVGDNLSRRCSWGFVTARPPSLPGGEGYSTNFYTGRLRPEVQPLTLLYTIFQGKGAPFVYLLFTYCTPFTYLVYNFVSLSTAVNALSFK